MLHVELELVRHQVQLALCCAGVPHNAPCSQWPLPHAGCPPQPPANRPLPPAPRPPLNPPAAALLHPSPTVATLHGSPHTILLVLCCRRFELYRQYLAKLLERDSEAGVMLTDSRDVLIQADPWQHPLVEQMIDEVGAAGCVLQGGCCRAGTGMWLCGAGLQRPDAGQADAFASEGQAGAGVIAIHQWCAVPAADVPAAAPHYFCHRTRCCSA